MDPEQHDSDVDEQSPRSVAGKWVILAIFLISIVGSTTAVWLVRPIPGSAPVDIEDRPFGPATRGEQNRAPLIYRSGDGQ